MDCVVARAPRDDDGNGSVILARRLVYGALVFLGEGMVIFNRLLEAIDAEGSGALVTLIGARGSSPRDVGARMIVRPSGAFHGTIGGGALEWEALRAALSALREGRGAAIRRSLALGPDLAQCCGGRVEWLIETFDDRDRDDLASLATRERAGAFGCEARIARDGRYARFVTLTPPGPRIEPLADGALRERFDDPRTRLLLFGAGHVGRAIVIALAPLPFFTRWIDSRPDAFPERAPRNVEMVRAEDPPREIDEAPAGAQILIMTHSHPLDLAIASAALVSRRFSYVGLIGSASKRARFLGQMRAANLPEDALARLVCPIGVPGLEGKEPEVIAASVAAQLLMARRGPDARESRAFGVDGGRRPPAAEDMRR
jgi:xanthine dehydrogenase accessory factor